MHRILFALALLALTVPAAAQEDLVERWSRPIPPFRILGNLYYVGSHEVTAFLLTTPEGHVLLDGGLPETAPMIAASIEALGFELNDVEVLLNSHAHFDHAGGLAELRERSGGKLMAMAEDAEWLRTGDADFGEIPAVPVARELRHGDKVELGGTSLVAHKTAGHTPGCTTWSTQVEEAGKRYDVVFVCSTSALPEHRLVDNPDYPQIAADFEAAFAHLRTLPVDVFLASHGSFFRLEEKRARLADGADGTVFVDPDGYRSFVDRKERQFQDELARQRAAAGSPGPTPLPPVDPVHHLGHADGGLDLGVVVGTLGQALGPGDEGAAAPGVGGGGEGAAGGAGEGLGLEVEEGAVDVRQVAPPAVPQKEASMTASCPAGRFQEQAISTAVPSSRSSRATA